MKYRTTVLTGVLLMAMLLPAIPASADWWDARRERNEGRREIARERREARREIARADTPWERRQEIREARREINRERREMRREVRREIDEPWWWD